MILALALLAAAGVAAALAGKGSSHAAATPQHGGSITIARIEDSQSFDKTNVFQNESIWLAEQIMEPLYTVTARRQEREAVARARATRSRTAARRTPSRSARASSSRTASR